tara:strand:+ start:43 stop:1167 length:1125 start_codon:yes stop_codon:yes gene_type:complete
LFPSFSSSFYSSTLRYIRRDTTAAELCVQLFEYLQINDEQYFDYFAIYSSEDGSRPTRALHDTDYISDARDTSAKLMYTIKFMSPKLLDSAVTNQVLRRLVFNQLRHDILIGNLFVNNETAIKLASCLFQENFGNPSNNNHKDGFISSNGRLSEFIPSSLMSSNQPEEWERLIFEQHHFLYANITKQFDNGTCSQDNSSPQQDEYCKICRTEASEKGMCGSKVWHVQQKTIPELPQHVVLGIYETGITIYNPDKYHSKKIGINLSFSFKILSKWGFNTKGFWWTVSKGTKYEFETEQGEIISSYLTSLAKLMLHHKKAKKKEEREQPAIRIQTNWRGHQARVKMDEMIDALEVRLTLAVIDADAPSPPAVSVTL